jgi:hypothetical protein
MVPKLFFVLTLFFATTLAATPTKQFDAALPSFSWARNANQYIGLNLLGGIQAKQYFGNKEKKVSTHAAIGTMFLLRPFASLGIEYKMKNNFFWGLKIVGSTNTNNDLFVLPLASIGLNFDGNFFQSFWEEANKK